MCLSPLCGRFWDRLLASKQTNIELAAFVFMPEHVHLLVVPTSTKPPGATGSASALTADSLQ